MLSSPPGGVKDADYDIRIPMDLYQGLGRFLDFLKLQIIEGAVRRAASVSEDFKPTAVRVEDVICAAGALLPDAAARLEASLRQIDSENARRKAS
jgi:hypothetical protein